MEYFSKQQNNNIDYNYREYIIDTSSQLESLPDDCCPGSIVFIVDEGKMKMRNLKGEWKDF